MKVKLEEIETCFQLLTEMIRGKGIQEIETGEYDLYWTVLSADWLEFEKEPKPGVGSLDDDFTEIKRLIACDSPPSTVDIERLAAVLRLISEELDQPTQH